MPNEEFRGRVVLITGAGRGIGAAVARDLATRGARLLLNDLGCELDGSGHDPSVVEAIAEQLRAAGAEVHADASDLRDRGAPAALIARAMEEFGRLDGVVHSAGVRRDRGILHVTEEDLDAYLDLQVRAAFGLTRAAARVMIDGGDGGTIVHMTAPAAFFGSTRRAGLAAAAAGVVALTRSAAVELRKHRIRVNAIAPTARTRATAELPMFKGVREDSMSPEHVAPIVAFLLGERGGDVSGEVVGVAGGRLYALRARETTGAFSPGGPFDVEEVAAAWADAMRGSVAREDR